ncbi:cytochrome P450 [Mycena latifolia]|nr:cytochrome P450 [Mycena latifolia]
MNDPILLLCIVLTLIAVVYFRKAFSDRKLDAIPIVGSSGLLSSYRDALSTPFHALDLLQQGYDRYPRGIFRVARPFRWEFIVCGAKLVHEIATAPEHMLSSYAAAEEAMKLKYLRVNHTIGPSIMANPYAEHTIRTSLTRNLHKRFSDVRDEIACAFTEVFQLQGSEWQAFAAQPCVLAIVARVSNRLFVGLPICRDQTYLKNSTKFTIDLLGSAARLHSWPPFLRPLVALFFTSKERCNAIALKSLGPLIETRLAKEKELGPDWSGKPNDLISWLLETAEGEERTTPALVRRILIINMAAIYTSSRAFTYALSNLASHPEHLLPMRKEAERIVRAQGWTKAALNRMVKIDSFLRESERINAAPVSLERKVVAKDGFRFSDGTVLPYGSFLSVAVRPTHYDPLNYENPRAFDGFRFCRESADVDSPNKNRFNRSMVSTAVDYLPFGTGKHACPGRFFAAMELKTMLAHLVINYDIKEEAEGVCPTNTHPGFTPGLGATGRVFLRKRQ